MKLSLQDLEPEGKRVLMRVDFNVPMNEKGIVIDDTRIKSSLPSIQYILKKGGILILMSHFGRPKGKVVPSLSLRPVAKRLSELMDQEVLLAPDSVGDEVEQLVKSLSPGQVLMLENLRFHKGEEHPNQEENFAEKLASLGDCYVNDAFGAAHRSHASITELPKFFPKMSAMGFLMEREVFSLSQVALTPKRPFYAIIGGAKIGTKLGILDALIEKIDSIFIGGGMAYTFLRALALQIGDSISDDAMLPDARAFLKACTDKAIQVHLPKDHLITNGEEIKIALAKDGIPEGFKGMDIGPQTVEEWAILLTKGSTIFWNGPMGVYENPNFSEGTKRIAQNLSMVSGDVIVGGGDSVAAVTELKLEKTFTHLSTGGGASLEFIEFGHLPGIDALTPK